MSNNFTVYDAYIGSQGLVYHEDAEAQPSDTSLPRDIERVFQPSNVNELTLRSGSLFAQGDFRGGMGQVFADRHSSSESAYLWSQGFDVTNGTLAHTQAWSEQHATVGMTAFAIAGGVLFGIVRNSTTLYRTTGAADPFTWSTSSVDATDTAWSITSAGTDIYIGTNGGIRKRTGAGVMSDELVIAGGAIAPLIYTKGRLVYFNSANNGIYEKAPGAAEVLIDTIPSGWTCDALFTSGTFIYAALSSGAGISQFWHYGLNTDGTAIVRKGFTELPVGVDVKCGAAYVGSVFFAGGMAEAINTVKPVLFRATPDDTGALQYELIAEGRNEMYATTPEGYVTAMATAPRGILLHWPTGTGDLLTGQGRSIAHYDLATGALTLLPKYSSTLATETVGLTRFQGRVVVGSNAIGKTYATDVDFSTGLPVLTSTATYISSIGDGNAPGIPKLYTRFNLRTKPLPANSSVAVYFSTSHPEENSWTLLGTYSTASGKGTTYNFPSGTVARSLAIKLVSTAVSGGADAPEIEGWDATFFPAEDAPSDAEWQLVRFIRILDKDKKDGETRGGGNRWIHQNPKTVKNAIYDLLHTQTTLYEPDATWTVLVENIRTIKPILPSYSETQGEARKEAYYLQIEFKGRKTA